MLVLDEKYKEFEGSLVPYEAIEPGATLETELEARGISIVDFAIMAKLPIETIEDFIAGKVAVTEDLANKLETSLGIDAAYWLRSQRHYEYCLLVIAERQKQKDAEKAKKPGFFKTLTKSAAML